MSNDHSSGGYVGIDRGGNRHNGTCPGRNYANDPRARGIAFACILSVICALAVSKFGYPDSGIAIWLLFIITSGLFIDGKHYSNTRQQYLLMLIPAITLIIAWVAGPLLWLNEGGQWKDWKSTFRMFIFLFPLLLIVTPPFLVLASFIREPLFVTLKMFDVPVEKYKKWLFAIQVLFVLGNILVAVLAALH